jgi:hypothetical protein
LAVTVGDASGFAVRAALVASMPVRPKEIHSTSQTPGRTSSSLSDVVSIRQGDLREKGRCVLRQWRNELRLLGLYGQNATDDRGE